MLRAIADTLERTMSEYAGQCIDMRADGILIPAWADGSPCLEGTDRPVRDHHGRDPAAVRDQFAALVPVMEKVLGD
jgi:hypothetical protein